MKRSKVLICSSLLLFICSLSSCSNNNSTYSPSSSINQSIEEGEYFLITFDAQGGEMNMSEYKLKAGEKLGLPTPPKKEGYIFKGWYYEKECINKFDENKVINENITLYAGYEKVDTTEYIEISSIEEFKNIENNKSYILTKDLDFNNEVIDPIGDRNAPYSGTFNGNGFTISNYKLEDSTYNGLFGYVIGSIKNLSVNVNLSITTDETVYVGAIAAYLYNGEIINCSSRGIINVTSSSKLLSTYCAGIVARNEVGVVSKCNSTISISNNNIATTYTGSIVGYNGGGSYLEALVIDSYAHDGTLSSSSMSTTGSAYTGGVVGFNFGTVDKCFSANMIIRSKTVEYHCFAAGVVADNNGGQVKNCFSTSSVEVISDSGNTFRGGVIGRNFRSSFESDSGTMDNCYSYAGQKVSYSISDSDALIEARHHQVVTEQVNKDYLSKATWYRDVLGFSSDYLIKDNYYPSLNSNFKKVSLNEELGTYANPIEITKAEELLNINHRKSYKLMNDIDVSSLTIKAIGTYKEPYFGTFDGNGYTIKGLNFSKDTNSGYNSLFGYVNGTIINLNTEYTVDNYYSTSKMPQYFGGIAAFTVKSLINNCSSTINANYSVVGGIFGGLVGYCEDSIINNSSTKGMINAMTKNMSSYVGGLIGVNETGIIKLSSSNINVEAYGEVNVCSGGLVGKNDGVIDYCYSISEIKVSSPKEINAGGLVGYNIRGSITNSYVVSDVDTTMQANLLLLGGFGGSNEATVSNCYYVCSNESLFSFGHSDKLVEITRINESELKNIEEKLAPYFVYDSDLKYLVLEGGKTNE